MRVHDLCITVLAASALACTSAKDDTGTADDTGSLAELELTDSTGPEIPDPSICEEDRAFCGTVVTPANFTGTPRSLAIALYTSIPPAGPPNAILAEIAAPSIGPSQRYPVRIQPMLETGEYYIWVNLYMEGGGEWMPVNEVDYTGATPAPLTLDGTVGEFDPITVEVASGW